jgi:hypothetical protein
MNDPVEGHQEDRGAPALPAIAEPDAAGRVGKGINDRLSSSLDNTGKALAAVAGVGVFFFAAGYFVQWQRFRRGGLPPEELLSLLPKGQIAAAGVKELFISLVFGGALLGLLGWGLVTIARLTQDKDRGLGGFVNRLFSRELLFPTLVVGVLTFLIVPWDKAGAIVAAMLTALFLCMLFLVQRFLEQGEGARFPLWQMSLSVGLTAIVLTGARVWEFPEPRPEAIVYLDDGSTIRGTYVASDSDKVLIRRAGNPTQLTMLSSDEVERVRLWRSTYAFERDPSLVDRVLLQGVFDADLDFSCIPPECRWGDNTRFGPSSAF